MRCSGSVRGLQRERLGLIRIISIRITFLGRYEVLPDRGDATDLYGRGQILSLVREIHHNFSSVEVFGLEESMFEYKRSGLRG
jgi:hypothetical protein